MSKWWVNKFTDVCIICSQGIEWKRWNWTRKQIIYLYIHIHTHIFGIKMLYILYIHTDIYLQIHIYEGGSPPKPRSIYKKCIFIFNVSTSVTFKVRSICCDTPIETFFPLLKTAFELVNFDSFEYFCHFLLPPLPHRQNIFFHAS